MELCPICRSSLHIERSYTTIEGKTIADAKAFTNIEQTCENPACANHKKVVNTEKVEQAIER